MSLLPEVLKVLALSNYMYEKQGENIFNTNEMFPEFAISYQHYNLTVTFSEAIRSKSKV